MSQEGQSPNRLQAYVSRLTPQVRGRLLAELERLHLMGQGIPGCDSLIASLRVEFRKSPPGSDRSGEPSTHFFQPLDPVLVSIPSADAHAGQISAPSLLPIWEWINQMLLPTMAREYDSKVRPAIAANKRRDVDQITAAFQSKVEKSLDGIFSDPVSVERIRGELAKITASATVVNDLEKVLRFLKSREALAQFCDALPKEITTFKGRSLVDMRQKLDALRARHADAVPFAMHMILCRLKEPWQLIRLVTDDSRVAETGDVAATPYASAFPAVLSVLHERRMRLIGELRLNHVLAARAILVSVYEFETALRQRTGHLSRSDWGQQLDRLIEMIHGDLETELHKLPDNLHHVLGSTALRQQGGMMGRIAWQLRGAASGLVATAMQRTQALLTRDTARS
jgi:hypothetical protein